MCGLYVTKFTEVKIQSFYIFKAQTRLKYICIYKQQPQKSLGQDILPKNLQIDPSFFVSYGMYAMSCFMSLDTFIHIYKAFTEKS